MSVSTIETYATTFERVKRISEDCSSSEVRGQESNLHWIVLAFYPLRFMSCHRSRRGASSLFFPLNIPHTTHWLSGSVRKAKLCRELVRLHLGITRMHTFTPPHPHAV